MASEVIERSLYNGQYNLVHNPNARGRAPRYLVNSTEKPKGVTTILGQTLAKDLMDWAVSCSIDYLRAKLPVVTEEDLKVASKAYTVKRDSGANTGTEAHALVEDHLKGRKVSLDGASQEAENAFNAFMEWYASVPIKVINVEEVIYSAEYKFAGTYDCMLEVDGKVYLCDLKTTNTSRKAPKGVYAENFIQLGAYAMAHEEQRVFELANGGTNLVEIEDLMVISAKKNGALDIVTASEMGLKVKECGEMMKRVVNIYQFLDYTSKKLSDK
jgi:hypothetical protein